MLKDLIAIANKLDQAGLTKEANELDEVIQKLAQTWPPSPELQQKFPVHQMMAVNGRLKMLKEELYDSINAETKKLYAAVDAEIQRLEQVAYNPPEGYVGTLEDLIDKNLPVTISSSIKVTSK